jgi:hypothetical protein
LLFPLAQIGRESLAAILRQIGKEKEMADYIKLDWELDQYCRELAKEILREIAEYGGDLSDQIHESADNSQHVIYHSRAHSICQNCNIDNGEAFVDEIGTPEGGWSYNGIASAMAYGEIVQRLHDCVRELELEEAEA